MIRDAREVFHEPDFTRPELDRIFAALGGSVVRLPGAQRREVHDLTPFLLAFARKADWQSGLPVSKRQFYRILKALRKDPIQGKVLEYEARGLSRRDLARLFDSSVPTIQSLVRGPSA